ncbi:hypothetical protein LTR86_005911 [Recurvomyces mirabilis]|nr:hypothetical protein LTR86_005911 [Recurvomyces mirabilis]
MERLILFGLRPVRLRQQFRVHPSIDSIINAAVYDGQLLNGDIPSTGPGVQKFLKFVERIKTHSTVGSFNADICALSQYRPARLPLPSLAGFGWQLVKMQSPDACYGVAGFAEEEFIVTAFYADQVGFLKALLGDMFPGVKIYTVDRSQGKENIVQIVDCVTLGGGAVPAESMGSLGGDKR